MIVAVPWRRNEDDAKMDGERRKRDVVMMDEDYKEMLQMFEHVSVPKRVFVTHEDLEVFGFTARCPWCMSLLKETARQAHKEKADRRGVERHCAGGSQRRVKEYQDKAAERGTKRTKWSPEEGQTDAKTIPTTTSSSSSSSGDAARTGSLGAGKGSSRVDNKRKADGEHREDPEFEDGSG